MRALKQQFCFLYLLMTLAYTYVHILFIRYRLYKNLAPPDMETEIKRRMKELHIEKQEEFGEDDDDHKEEKEDFSMKGDDKK